MPQISVSLNLVFFVVGLGWAGMSRRYCWNLDIIDEDDDGSASAVSVIDDDDDERNNNSRGMK
jgi:hypothetical protein